MRMLRLSWSKKCLLILWAVAACGGPATVAVPTGAPAPRAVEERLLDQISEGVCPHPEDPSRIDPYERYFTSDDPAYTFICYPAAGHSHDGQRNRRNESSLWFSIQPRGRNRTSNRGTRLF